MVHRRVSDTLTTTPKTDNMNPNKYPDPLADKQNVCGISAMDCCSGRQSGKAVLNDIIHRLRRKAENLQTLVNMLPEQPTAEQDQQLWELACAMER